MVLIPKMGSGSMAEIRIYMGIALSSLLSKISDKCIISNQHYRVFTNDLQFAYTMFLSIISGRCSLRHYFTAGTNTTHRCFKRKGVINLRFVYTQQG